MLRVFISVVPNSTTLKASIVCKRVVGIGSHLGVVRCLLAWCWVVGAWSLGIIVLLLLLLGLLLVAGWVGGAGLRSLLVCVAGAIASSLRLGGVELPLFLLYFAAFTLCHNSFIYHLLEILKSVGIQHILDAIVQAFQEMFLFLLIILHFIWSIPR
jgi:hypothetical protein